MLLLLRRLLLLQGVLLLKLQLQLLDLLLVLLLLLKVRCCCVLYLALEFRPRAGERLGLSLVARGGGRDCPLGFHTKVGLGLGSRLGREGPRGLGLHSRSGVRGRGRGGRGSCSANVLPRRQGGLF